MRTKTPLAAASLLLLWALPVSAAPTRSTRPGNLELAVARAARVGKTIPLVLTTDGPPSAETLDKLRRAGARVLPFSVRGKVMAVEIAAADVDKLANVPEIQKVELDGPIVKAPRPLDVTQELISVDAVHRSTGVEGLPIAGTGMTICDVDAGIDVFHPMFFRADGGLIDFEDENENGFLDPGVDKVTIDGAAVPLLALNGIVWDRGTGDPLFGTEDEALDLKYDYLYADLNGDGKRNAGLAAGFTEDSPTYGEPLFVVDDVNGDGELSSSERLVALGTSKIKAFRVDGDTYRRGDNLIEAPWSEAMQHGNGASGVLIGGQLGYGRLVGMAPNADLVMATGDGREFQLTQYCISQGADVVLHEYAPWYGFHMDGSSALEGLIDSSSDEGVVHVNPAGNLSTSSKMMKRLLEPDGVTEIPIEVPNIDATFMVSSIWWREPTRDLGLSLTSPNGQTVEMNVAGPSPFVGALEGKDLYAFREDSDRGTARIDFYVYDEGQATLVPPGTWTVTLTDPSNGPPLEVVASVFDEVSGWGTGIRFLEDVTEDHLVGWPGTADKGLGVAAFVGHDAWYGESGERAFYSGRGHRMDGRPLIWISAPDNPIVPGRFEESELSYLVYGGTSGASPHVAGAAALILEARGPMTGEEVKGLMRDGAVTDDLTGQVPNDDWGWGKLNAYKAIYGEDAPSGTAPVVESTSLEIPIGTASVPLEVVDAEDAPSTLKVEADLDYDGTFDQVSATSDTPSLEGPFDAVGERRIKVRVTDPTGRYGQAVISLNVFEPEEEPEPEPEPIDNDTYFPSGGCTASPLGAPNGLATAFGLGLLLSVMGRRKRAPRSRPKL